MSIHKEHEKEGTSNTGTKIKIESSEKVQEEVETEKYKQNFQYIVPYP